MATVFTLASGSHCWPFSRVRRAGRGSLHACVPLQVSNRSEAHLELNAFRRKHDCALVISGDSLEVGAGALPAGSSREHGPLPASVGAVTLADPPPPASPSQICLKFYEYEFMELACQCPAVVCCRCTPTQKAQIVRLLQERTGKLTCAVGRRCPAPLGPGRHPDSSL